MLVSLTNITLKLLVNISVNSWGFVSLVVSTFFGRLGYRQESRWEEPGKGSENRGGENF